MFSAAYFLYKRYESQLSDLLNAYPSLTQNGNVLDIGANIGYTASLFAKKIGTQYLVHAFEPEPRNYQMLKRLAARREYAGRIIAYQSAVGAEEGSVQLWLNEGHHADHRVITDRFGQAHRDLPSVTVPLVSIDTFLQSHPGPVSLVKVDVQGFELPVCRGMLQTIQRHPNLNLILEYAPSGLQELGFNPTDLLDLLAGCGFSSYAIGARGELTPGVPASIKDSDYVDLLFTRNPLPPRVPAR